MSQPATPENFPYATFLNVLVPQLQKVEVDPLVKAVTHPWYNQTLCKVNDSVIRLGVMQGEYHWHKHEKDDEFFFVLEGTFLIDLEVGADGKTPGKVITLKPREGFVVPANVVHRTRAPEKSVILMVETAAIIPTGD
jgi:mannose-6-phosphate isomerase-like protein (cupin superfamily)